MNITFRPISDEDLPFLCRLYASTRAAELSVVPWTDEEKELFLRQQFEAQHKYYRENYSSAQFDIICLNDAAVGRVYVDRREDEHRIVDIALLPELRGKGIGGGIMRDLVEEAATAGKPVSIHVERNNPALHLYKRLGFQQIGDTGVYLLMEWHPDRPGTAR